MLYQTFWKRNVGWFSGLVVLPLVWYLLGDYIRDGGQLYRVDLSSKATAATFLSLTIVAASAAWESARVSPVVRATPGINRATLSILLVVCGPAFISSCAGYLLAVGARFLSVGMQPPIPTVSVFGGVVALHLAVAFIGAAIGSMSASYLAAPMAGTVIYGLFISLGVASNGTQRLLFGQQYGCCALDQAPSTLAIAIPTATAIGLGVLAVAILAWRWKRHVRLPLAGAFAAAVLVGCAGWVTLGADQGRTTTPRSGELVCKTSAATAIEYCVWPEHDHLLAQLVTVGDIAFDDWGAATPIEMPKLVTEQRTTGAPLETEVLPLAVGPKPADEDIIAALALGMLPPLPNCASGWQNGAAYTQLMAWLLLSAGVSADHPNVAALRAMSPPGSSGDPVSVARQLESSTLKEQQAWLDHALAAFQTCDPTVSASMMLI